MSELPIACTLGSEDLAARRADLLTTLSERALAAELLGSGIEFQFDGSSNTLADLARVIDAERQCCRFFRFELMVAPDLGPITLRMTGPAGAREFLASLLERPRE